MATQEPVVMIDDKEIKVSELTNEQQYFHSQILDLTNKQNAYSLNLPKLMPV